MDFERERILRILREKVKGTEEEYQRITDTLLKLAPHLRKLWARHMLNRPKLVAPQENEADTTDDRPP